ncbi:MAG: YggS family pyridoxal phosphate-dependent enzyme [Armatimonadota bacterium]
MADLASNLKQVQERIAAAAHSVGRDAAEITLVAVSKTRPVAEISAAVAAGALEFGENYAQELCDKQSALAGSSRPPRWHFIGHLQRNKVRFLVPFCALIEVVDSVSLAEEISRRAAQVGRVQPVLLQVDLAGEETKFGCSEAETPLLGEVLVTLPGVEWQGLMTIPPLGHDPEQSRPYFRRLAQLRHDLSGRGVPECHLRHLSMGMSNDFEVAIEEGATLVRVGTAIFGPRAARP